MPARAAPELMLVLVAMVLSCDESTARGMQLILADWAGTVKPIIRVLGRAGKHWRRHWPHMTELMTAS